MIQTKKLKKITIYSFQNKKINYQRYIMDSMDSNTSSKKQSIEWLFGEGAPTKTWCVYAKIDGNLMKEFNARKRATGITIPDDSNGNYQMTFFEIKINSKHHSKSKFDDKDIHNYIRKRYEEVFIKTETVIANTFTKYKMIDRDNKENFVKVYDLDSFVIDKIKHFQAAILFAIKLIIIESIEETTVVHNNITHHMFSTCNNGIKTPFFAIPEYYYNIEKFDAHVSLLNDDEVKIASKNDDENANKKVIILGKILKAGLPTLSDIVITKNMRQLEISEKNSI